MKRKQFQNMLSLLFVCFGLLFSNSMVSQVQEETEQHKPTNNLKFGINLGYDILPGYNSNYTYYDINGGPKFGLTVDYNLGLLGLGLDYDYLKNSPLSSISDPIYYDTLQINSSAKSELTESITRHFIGIGPNVNLELGKSIDFKLFARGGYAVTKGGELITTAIHPDGSKVDHHVMFSGLDAAGLAFKGGVSMDYSLTDNLAISVGAYYLNHLSVKPDRAFDLNNRGNMGMVYGHTPFVNNQNNYAIGLGAPYIISSPVDFSDISSPFSSIGLNLGITYTLKSKTDPVEEEIIEIEEESSSSKVAVTVKDEISNQNILGANVTVRDLDGNVVASGTTNIYGEIEFNDLTKDNYVISANVFGTETSTTAIAIEEWETDGLISKELLYSDLQFILRGSAFNKLKNTGEPGVVVNLTNRSNGKSKYEKTGADGNFSFKLEPNSSYELVGVKENRLSEIKKASTVGLTRSTTLFVELEIGVENFDCGRGTILDIKYDYDKWDLLSTSKLELDRVIRYMKDHPTSKIEMSSHTDSRGSNKYNLTLSDKRARSAMTYIISKGIASSRVIAQGYGETRLKNNCKDGQDCSEADHSINRRTEATLICRQ